MSRYIAIFSSNSAHVFTMAKSLSPQVEAHPGGAVVLSTSSRYEQITLDRLFQFHLAAGRIDFAAASSRTVAIFAAKARPGSIIPAGDEEAFLSPFPIRFFLEQIGEEVSDELLETLARWGIRTLGQLAGLPESELVVRLGNPGLRLKKLARGEDLLPFQAHIEEPRFEERKDLEWELDGLEPLSFILGDLLERICQRLYNRGQATDSLEIWFQLSDGSLYHRSISLAFPMRNAGVLLSLVRLKLQSDPPGNTLTGIRVEAYPARPQVFQYSLIDRDAPDPEAFSRTMARLTALLGEDRMGSPSVLDTHRPDAFEVRQFSAPTNGNFRNGRKHCASSPGRNGCRLILRRVRPPAPTWVQVDQIVACSGPWHSSGEWWNGPADPGSPNLSGQAWSRQEWDIETVDGRICRVFWDPKEKQWFLEGVYD